MRHLALAVLALPLLFDFGASPAPLAAQAAEPLLPDPAAALTLDPTEEGALASVLRELCASAEVNLFVSEEAKQVLSAGASNLQAVVELPPAEAWSFVGSLLVENQLTMILHRERVPRLISIHHRRLGQAPHGLKEHAFQIDVSQLDEVAKHPALLAQVLINTEHLDARNLVNSLRAMMTDNAVQSMLPGGDTGSLFMTSHGASIERIARTIQGMDAAAGRAAERRLLEAEPESEGQGAAAPAEESER